MIGDPNGGPSYSLVCDSTNNPASQVALGYMRIDARVKYYAVVEKLLVNVEGGASVQILRQGATANS